MSENHSELWEILDAAFLRDDSAQLAHSRQILARALAQQTYAYDGLEWDITGVVWFVVGEQGLVAVQMGDLSEDEFLAHQAERLGKGLRRDDSLTAPYRAELTEYLAGKRDRFDLPIDWSQVSPFQARVLQQTLQIPRGQALTYGALAEKIGNAKAARAVGRALGTNPMPIIIPCHRIVGAKGDLTGYIGGLSAKQHLLTLEGYLK